MSGTSKGRIGQRIHARIGPIWLTAGFLFLYVPIATLIAFSFNGSKLVTLWGGFSLRWYEAILTDHELIDAFIVSIKIAVMTATASVVLGTLAAYTLVRYTRFPGRTLFVAHVNAPLVVPEVITGLSLLLLFVASQNLFGIPSERGMLTIWIGHTSICTSYAAVVIQSRLSEMDRSLEEAAMDLGARPFQVFCLITLPLIAPALLSAWLLTLTISLDDVVTTAFLKGPGSTTLPVVIFSRARLGLNPSVNVVATFTVVVVALGILVASAVVRRAERRRARESALALQDT